MNYDYLIDAEIGRIKWGELREAAGPAESIPVAIRELLQAKMPGEATKAYWKLENHVVAQGQLFESSVYVIPVLLAALVDPDRPKAVRAMILELIFQIVAGYPDASEEARGLTDLDERCKVAAREGMWLIYRELAGDLTELSERILDILGAEKDRVSAIKASASR